MRLGVCFRSAGSKARSLWSNERASASLFLPPSEADRAGATRKSTTRYTVRAKNQRPRWSQRWRLKKRRVSRRPKPTRRLPSLTRYLQRSRRKSGNASKHRPKKKTRRRPRGLWASRFLEPPLFRNRSRGRHRRQLRSHGRRSVNTGPIVR